MVDVDIKNISDEDLVNLVRSENKELYSELVMRYQKKLLRYAYYLLKNSAEAEDAVQNSFIKAYKGLFTFNVKKKFSSWIYRITHNEAINLLRKRGEQISLEENSYLTDKLPSNDNIQLEMEKKDIGKKVRQILLTLPSKYKEPLILYFLEDKSYEDISDILRLPVNTVGTRISRGKTMLKKIMPQEGT